MTYTQFKNEWLNRRVDYDKIYAFQCVDLITQYCYELGFGSGIWGNAIDYANRPTPTFVANFSRVGDYKQGDIVVLYGLAGNPYGHIGILDSSDAGTVRLLEQNGATGNGSGTGNDAIKVWRSVPKSRVAAIWRLKSAAPPPPPPPARQTVTLPGHVQSWRLYRVGSGLRPNTTDQIATLAPSQFGGLTYKVEAWVGDYAVVITTQMFGRGTIWLRDTDAVVS